VDRIDRVAALARHGFGLNKGERAAIASRNSLECIEIADGLSEAGAATATPNPRQPID
jgi:acyl-CoA synthetase (AMP-forming)/AMP-acid ligase II